MPLISNLEPTLVMLCLLHWKSPNVARQSILAVVIVKSYSLLCAMALKMATDNFLGVTTVDPYQSTKKKVLFIPNRDILLDEIKRRADIFDVLP